MHGYVPQDSRQYYDATHLARMIDAFNDVCLLYLMNGKSDEAKREGMMVQFEEIVAYVASLLLKNKSDRFLCGDKHTIADFAFMGLFLALQDQPIAKDIMAVINKFKTVEEYANYHRDAFLPDLIKGGRFMTCYAPQPYSTLFQLVMAYNKIRPKIVEAKEPRIVIAGIVHSDFFSALEMIARTLGLLKNDHIFENLYYRDIASSLLFPKKVPTKEELGEALYLLNNYYGYMRNISKGKKWPATLADIFSAVATEECCKRPELCELIKTKFAELYEFQKDFLMRHKRTRHCIILKSAPAADAPLPPDSIQLLNFMNMCRHDLHDVMRNLGFQTVETIYPLLSNYPEVLGKILERPDYKNGDVEIFAYIDANQHTDMMVGYSGIKFLEDHNASFAGCSYDFAYYTVDKLPMKKHFAEHKVPTSPYVYLDKWDEEAVKKAGMFFPVVVKLSDAYASFGMTKDSKCTDMAMLERVTKSRFQMYNNHPVLVESFVEGREYTVVITGIYDKEIHAYPPIERVFDESVPLADRWLYFEFYWRSPVQKLFFKKIQDEKVIQEVVELAKLAFVSVHGNGYGRVDIRQDAKTGKFYVLEINCMCAVGFESTSFYTLKESGLRTEDLFEDIFYYGKLKCSQKK